MKLNTYKNPFHIQSFDYKFPSMNKEDLPTFGMILNDEVRVNSIISWIAHEHNKRYQDLADSGEIDDIKRSITREGDIIKATYKGKNYKLKAVELGFGIPRRPIHSNNDLKGKYNIYVGRYCYNDLLGRLGHRFTAIFPSTGVHNKFSNSKNDNDFLILESDVLELEYIHKSKSIATPFYGTYYLAKDFERDDNFRAKFLCHLAQAGIDPYQVKFKFDRYLLRDDLVKEAFTDDYLSKPLGSTDKKLKYKVEIALRDDEVNYPLLYRGGPIVCDNSVSVFDELYNPYLEGYGLPLDSFLLSHDLDYRLLSNAEKYYNLKDEHYFLEEGKLSNAAGSYPILYTDLDKSSLIPQKESKKTLVYLNSKSISSFIDCNRYGDIKDTSSLTVDNAFENGSYKVNKLLRAIRNSEDKKPVILADSLVIDRDIAEDDHYLLKCMFTRITGESANDVRNNAIGGVITSGYEGLPNSEKRFAGSWNFNGEVEHGDMKRYSYPRKLLTGEAYGSRESNNYRQDEPEDDRIARLVLPSAGNEFYQHFNGYSDRVWVKAHFKVKLGKYIQTSHGSYNRDSEIDFNLNEYSNYLSIVDDNEYLSKITHDRSGKVDMLIESYSFRERLIRLLGFSCPLLTTEVDKEHKRANTKKRDAYRLAYDILYTEDSEIERLPEDKKKIAKYNKKYMPDFGMVKFESNLERAEKHPKINSLLNDKIYIINPSRWTWNDQSEFSEFISYNSGVRLSDLNVEVLSKDDHKVEYRVKVLNGNRKPFIYCDQNNDDDHVLITVVNTKPVVKVIATDQAKKKGIINDRDKDLIDTYPKFPKVTKANVAVRTSDGVWFAEPYDTEIRKMKQACIIKDGLNSTTIWDEVTITVSDIVEPGSPDPTASIDEDGYVIWDYHGAQHWTAGLYRKGYYYSDMRIRGLGVGKITDPKVLARWGEHITKKEYMYAYNNGVFAKVRNNIKIIGYMFTQDYQLGLANGKSNRLSLRTKCSTTPFVSTLDDSYNPKFLLPGDPSEVNFILDSASYIVHDPAMQVIVLSNFANFCKTKSKSYLDNIIITEDWGDALSSAKRDVGENEDTYIYINANKQFDTAEDIEFPATGTYGWVIVNDREVESYKVPIEVDYSYMFDEHEIVTTYTGEDNEKKDPDYYLLDMFTPNNRR